MKNESNLENIKIICSDCDSSLTFNIEKLNGHQIICGVCGQKLIFDPDQENPLPMIKQLINTIKKNKHASSITFLCEENQNEDS